MRRSVERSNDTEPLLLRPFCQGCIIATRGYDFRKGQGIVQVLIGNVELQRQQQPAIRSRALEYMTVHAIDFLYDLGFIGDHHDQAASQNGLHDS